MGKIGFITDSTAYLHPSFIEEHKIKVVSLIVNFEGESFPEAGLYENFEEFYDRLRQVTYLPTTSQPPLGKFLDAYQELGERVDSIISVHITEGISGTVETALAAARMLPHLDITVIDSNGTAVAEYMILDAAVRAVMKGLTRDEVLNVIQHIVDHHTFHFLPDTLEYLRRGGRIGGAAALVGTLLQIKPILYFNRKKNCIIDVYEKVRTREKGLQKIINEMGRAYAKCPDIKVAVVEVGARKSGKDLAERVCSLYPEFEPEICPVGPVIGAHIGPGTVGLCYYPMSPQIKELF
ncbi:MAG TPA: DegV family protein [Syntrophomonadaceae bacterium]|nr:DegV family protein [Syntrophomonadaceae bacterium]